jgi:acetyltransferase-like isoleucine patch superfamily enzyme
MALISNIIGCVSFKLACLILSGETKIRFLRSHGLTIGKRCVIDTTNFSSEPYLITLGDHVVISNGTKFVTHDGAGWTLEDRHPDLDLFGQIIIGDNTFVGIDVIILANTVIGSNCIIGAGSVVRGHIPDNSVVCGNPGRVIMHTKMFESMYVHHNNCLKTRGMGVKEKKRIIMDHFNVRKAETTPLVYQEQVTPLCNESR